MKNRRVLSLVAVAALSIPVVLWGQETARPLRDLLGVSASSGEQQVEARGYRYVRTVKEADASLTFWLEPQTNRCVSIRTANGIYTNVFYVADSSCALVPATPPPSASPDSDESFDTVCGVEIGKKSHRYRCHYLVEGCKGEGYCRGVVTMPDNEYTIDWNTGGDKIEVTFKGMRPQKTPATFDNGQTRFKIGDQTYFVYRSRERAKSELEKLPRGRQ